MASALLSSHPDDSGPGCLKRMCITLQTAEYMMLTNSGLVDGFDIEVPDTIASHFPKDYSSIS
jgi:hypothetical protein